MDRSSSQNFLTSKFDETKPLGQILNEAGLISAQQIEVALQEQAEMSQMKIGEIFASKNWVKQKTADFFAERWYELLQQEQKYPLVYYFQEAGLLDVNQIKSILEQRDRSQEKVRFHHLAVQQGLIQQQTVDFFLRNLLLVSSKQKNFSSSISLVTPYKILQNYFRGETDFQQSQLRKIKLNHV